MYVCVCNAVRDREIQRALDRGIDSFDGLMKELGVGMGCGSCEEAVREMLAERLRAMGFGDWVSSAA